MGRWSLRLLGWFSGSALCVALAGGCSNREPSGSADSGPGSSGADAAARYLPERLTENALEQLRLIDEDKASWTPALEKLSSNLIYAIKYRRRDSIFLMLPEMERQAALLAQGDPLVDIKGTVDGSLITEIIALGGVITASVPRFGAVQARVPLDALETLAADPRIRQIREASDVTTYKDNTSQGDVAHRADVTRALKNLTGAGATIGVISDGVATMAARQATGDLPPSPQLQVLAGQTGSSGDEGTALLEIVHDLAPGANLLFSTHGPSMAQMAQNILSLQAAGADIIVDDVGFVTEAAFQDDVIAQAVEMVAAAGVLYFSAAGNAGNKNDGTSGVYESDYVPTTTPAAISSVWPGRYVDVHDFGAGATFNTLTVDGMFDFTQRITLQWSDPLDGSSNDYDLILMNSAGTSITASVNAQTGTQDPSSRSTASARTTPAGGS